MLRRAKDTATVQKQPCYAMPLKNAAIVRVHGERRRGLTSKCRQQERRKKVLLAIGTTRYNEKALRLRHAMLCATRRWHDGGEEQRS